MIEAVERQNVTVTFARVAQLSRDAHENPARAAANVQYIQCAVCHMLHDLGLPQVCRRLQVEEELIADAILEEITRKSAAAMVGALWQQIATDILSLCRVLSDHFAEGASVSTGGFAPLTGPELLEDDSGTDFTSTLGSSVKLEVLQEDGVESIEEDEFAAGAEL
eukprot:4761095-Amphidinium_carterae.1